MKAHDAFPSDFISTEELKGSPQTHTIKQVEMVAFDDGEQAVMTFDSGKKISLNRTNWGMCEELFDSDDSDDWIGQKIEIYADRTEFKGKRVDCKRVRAAKDGAAADGVPF